MLLNAIHKDFFRAEVNSKDAYPTAPVAEEKKIVACWLFKATGSFKILSPSIRNLCCSLYLLKDSKAMQQFNIYAKQVCPHHHLSGQYATGITNRELISAQDLSAALWIFSALGFVINIKTNNNCALR